REGEGTSLDLAGRGGAPGAVAMIAIDAHADMAVCIERQGPASPDLRRQRLAVRSREPHELPGSAELARSDGETCPRLRHLLDEIEALSPGIRSRSGSIVGEDH